MPVRKFRTVEELNEPAWRRPGDPALFRAMAALWAAGRRMRPRRFPPGVHRHVSIADMNATQEAWAQEHVDAVQRGQSRFRRTDLPVLPSRRSR
jgi:hypothetical protein